MAISSLFFCLEVLSYMFCFAKKVCGKAVEFYNSGYTFWKKKMTAFYKHDKGQIIIFQ